MAPFSQRARFCSKEKQRFVSQPSQPVPPKAVAGQFKIPNGAAYQKPADEYKKGPAGDTRHHVQVSEASLRGTEQDYHRTGRNNTNRGHKAAPDYVIPPGFSEVDYRDKNPGPGSGLPAIGMKRGQRSSSSNSQRGVQSLLTTAMEQSSQIAPAKTHHPLDFTLEWTRAERKKAYDCALKKVGEQGVEHILDTVRNKVELQTRGGLAQLNSAFHFFDKDRSASIDLVEFSSAMEAFGLQFDETQLTAVFAVYDEELQGGISYDSFSTAMQADRMRRTAQSASSDMQRDLVKKHHSKVTGAVRATSYTSHKQLDTTHSSAHGIAEQPHLQARPPQFRQFHSFK